MDVITQWILFVATLLLGGFLLNGAPFWQAPPPPTAASQASTGDRPVAPPSIPRARPGM